MSFILKYHVHDMCFRSQFSQSGNVTVNAKNVECYAEIIQILFSGFFFSVTS